MSEKHDGEEQQQEVQQQCNTGPVSISQNNYCLPYISRTFRYIISVKTRNNKNMPAYFFQINRPTTESLLSPGSEEHDSQSQIMAAGYKLTRPFSISYHTMHVQVQTQGEDHQGTEGYKATVTTTKQETAPCFQQ